MKTITKLKKKYFPKGVKRGLARYSNMAFNRTTEENLTKNLKKLEIKPGSVICVHSMLSGLGYIVGGPQTVIRAIQKAVPDCTIMMPSFPFDGSAIDYLKTNPIYHRLKSPSKSGLLTETLRLYPGSKRSYHPTHPCVALGPKADYLIDGSENSETPFGDDSTYGRFSDLDNAVLLLIHTNNTSIVHRIQETVHTPNLFMKDDFCAEGFDQNNNLKKYNIKIHTSILPLYVIMPSDNNVEYVWYPDYVLLFPKYNENRILNKIKSEKVRQIFMNRNNFFIQKGIIKTVKHHEAELASINVRSWFNKINNDLIENIKKYSEYYQYEKMKIALDKGLLSKFDS